MAITTRHHTIPKSRLPDNVVKVNDVVKKKSTKVFNNAYITDILAWTHNEYHRFFGNRSPYEVLYCVLDCYGIKDKIINKEKSNKVFQDFTKLILQLYPVKDSIRKDFLLLNYKENLYFQENVVKKVPLHVFLRKLFRIWNIKKVVDGFQIIKEKDMLQNQISPDLAYAMKGLSIRSHRKTIGKFQDLIFVYSNRQIHRQKKKQKKPLNK